MNQALKAFNDELHYLQAFRLPKSNQLITLNHLLGRMRQFEQRQRIDYRPLQAMIKRTEHYRNSLV